MGFTLAELATPTISKAAFAAYDFVRPDFNDPASLGANFWMETYEDFSEFSGFGDIDYYKTDIRVVKGVPNMAIADMELDYFNLSERPRQFMADLITAVLVGNTFANKRWSNAVEAGAPVLAELIDSKKYSIILVPGINSSGLDGTQLELIAASLSLEENQTLVVLHSAGVELGARTMPLVTRDKSEVFYLVLSPRMDDSTLQSWMEKGGVLASNVLSINSAKDFPHWSDWSVLVPRNIESALMGHGYMLASNLSRFWHDYDYNSNAGTHVFLKEDVTGDRKQELGHSSMIHGLYNDRLYNIEISGWILYRRISVDTIINQWLERNYKR